MDLGQILLAALAGGASGATTGGLVGGIGALPGAIGGALIGGGGTLLDQLFGNGEFIGGVPEQTKRVSTVTGQQRNVLNALLNQGQSILQNPYQGFEDIQNQTLNAYRQNILPGLSEQFSSLGSNRLSSPAFEQRLGQSANDLASQLGYLRNQYGRERQQAGLGLINTGLSPQFQNVQMAAQPGLLETLLPQALKMAPIGLSALTAPQGQGQQAAFEMLKSIYGGR